MVVVDDLFERVGVFEARVMVIYRCNESVDKVIWMVAEDED